MLELDPISRLEYELAELQRQVNQMIMPATVTYVYRKAGEDGIQSERDDGTWLGYVDVEVDGQEVQRIPFKTERHGNDRTFWLPSEGEKGQLLSPSGDYANGTFYPATAPKRSNRVTPQGVSTEQRITAYRDSTEQVYDTEKHTENLNIPHADGEHNVTIKDSHIRHNTKEIIVETGEKLQATVQDAEITLTATELNIKIPTKTRVELTNPLHYEELSAIVKSIFGAFIFPTGLTNLVNAAGAVMFPPGPTPASAPALPAGTPKDANGKASGVPDEQIDNVVVRSGSNLKQTWVNENITQTWTGEPMSLIILTPIPVATPAGPGTVVPGTYAVQLTGAPSTPMSGSPDTPVTGKLHVTLPSRSFG